MSEQQSLVVICMWVQWKIVKVLTVQPEHIGGPLLPVLCTPLMRSLNFVVLCERYVSCRRGLCISPLFLSVTPGTGYAFDCSRVYG